MSSKKFEERKKMWTQFWDMHSGGSLKEKWHYIYIEAPEDEAIIIFYNRFGHNPRRVTCTCCGDDYSISEKKSLARLTAYHRNCEFVENKKEEGGGHYAEKQKQSAIEIREECDTPAKNKWGLYQTLTQYRKNKDVLIIPAKSIKAKERKGEVPEQGYVWKD